MLTKKPLLLLFAALGSLLLASGCVIDASDDCYEVCDTVCEVRCNPWECWEVCWDECWDECSYVEYEEEYYDDEYYDDVDRPRDECSVDADCGQGESCDRGDCVVDTTGVGLCQPCERNNDCLEEGARCLQLNGEEKVCGRACEEASDCPRGFECLEVSREVGVSSQCVPMAEGDEGLRSCVLPEEEEPEPEPELECTRNTDCGQGQICVDAMCQDDPQANACDDTHPCEEGLVCEQGQCVQPPQACEADTDCGDGEICTEGLCSPLECRRSEDCQEGNLCVNARCYTACDEENPCGEGLSCEAPGYCAPAEVSQGCEANADCPSGQACMEGACVSL